MKFYEVQKSLSEGKLARRRTWNPNTYVFGRPGDHLEKDVIPKVKSLPKSIKKVIEESEYEVIYFYSYLCKYYDGCVINGWTPSLDEALECDDWEVVE